MTRTLTLTALCAALLAGTGAAHANKLLDGLKSQIGGGQSSSGPAAPETATGAAAGGGLAGLGSSLGLAMPALGSNTMGNAAGVLQYCVQNNYLSAANANSVKDKLLGAVTGQKQQQEGFKTGAAGVLQGTDGKSFSLSSVSGKLKEKACDYVLQNAGSLL